MSGLVDRISDHTSVAIWDIATSACASPSSVATTDSAVGDKVRPDSLRVH